MTTETFLAAITTRMIGLSLPLRTKTLDLQSLNIYFAADPLICQRDDGLSNARLLVRVVRFHILLLTYFAALVEMLRRKE
jgi:hypothetical protein